MELSKCHVFQFSDDHRHGSWPSPSSYGKANKYISDVVELRHPAILQAGPTAYRGVQNHYEDQWGPIILLCHTDVEEANGVHKNIQSGSC